MNIRRTDSSKLGVVRRVAVAATGVAALSASVVLNPAAAFAAPGGMAITGLMCNKSEDEWGADEPYIDSDSGGRLWGPGSLSTGQAATITGVVTTASTVILYDEDSPDPDDKLAEIPVKAGSFLVGYGSGAAYTITFSPA